MKQIPLTQGLFALVDDEDYDKVNKYKWYADKSFYTYYALRKLTVDGKRIAISMHRTIYGDFVGVHIDHKDGDGLNNQKSNLRFCNGTQNNANKRKAPRQFTSIYKGVHKHKKYTKRPWLALIRTKEGCQRIGCFADEADAARAYDKEAIRIFGEYARTNFPRESYE